RAIALPPIRLSPSVAREVDMPRSGFSPFAPAWISPCDISIILLASPIIQRSLPEAQNLALKLKVTFCVRGVISPLLSNLVLDELDQELERRGHRFVRYADDSNIYVSSERAGQRVMESVKRFITEKLKLKVNESKDPKSTGTP